MVMSLFNLEISFIQSNPKTQELILAAQALFSTTKDKNIEWRVLGGNHDYSSRTDTFAPQIFESISSNVSIISKPIFLDNYVYLPWQPKATRDEYHSILIKHGQESRGVFYHFPDETQSFTSPVFNFSEFMSNSNIELNLMGGDIHIPNERYIGVVFPTRIDEANVQGKLVLLNEDDGSVIETIEIPKTVEFIDLKFGDPMPPQVKDKTYKIRIRDVESYESVVEMYESNMNNVISIVPKKYIISSNDSSGESLEESLTIQDYFRLFSEENQIDEDIQEIITKVLYE